MDDFANDDPPPRPGRRPARTPEQLRADMVVVGLGLLAERGLNIGLDTVRFDEVIEAADAPRASAYRASAPEATATMPARRSGSTGADRRAPADRAGVR